MIDLARRNQPGRPSVKRLHPLASRSRVDLRAAHSLLAKVTGGVEEGEDLPAAARRETAEEAGLAGGSPLYKLDMVSGVARIWFAASRDWPADLYIVAKHHFGMDVTAEPAPVALSREHSEFRWAPYGEASEILSYDDDKTALWELDARLQSDDLPAALS